MLEIINYIIILYQAYLKSYHFNNLLFTMVAMNEKKGSAVLTIISMRNFQLNYWLVTKKDIIVAN